MPRPKIFIASASETLEYAHALRSLLQKKGFAAQVWDQEPLGLSASTIEALTEEARKYDYAVAICGPDDRVTTRGQTFSVPRDNVIFETGLFMGLLGRKRVFCVVPAASNIKLPSDLLSFGCATYYPNEGGSLTNALEDAADQIKKAIERNNTPPDHRSSEQQHVAAVCIRRVDGETQYLLIKTSRGRWLIPKGAVSPGEDLVQAALRYAHDEGGVVGRPLDFEPIEFTYFKEGWRHEQRIKAFIIEVSEQVDPEDDFREPTWFSAPEAEQKIAARRDFLGANALRHLVRGSELHLRGRDRVKAQCGALPFRISPHGEIEVLLITSRNTGRWVIPKGNIEKGDDIRSRVKIEAFEEAGVEGDVHIDKLCTYEYLKPFQKCSVDVYPMAVRRELDDWPDKNTRIRRWFELSSVEEQLEEPMLRESVRAFARMMERTPALYN